MSKTIAFITDAHIEHQFPKEQGVRAKDNWEILLKSIQAHAVDMVVFGGDIGETSIFPYFFDTFTGLDVPYYNILGNHDLYEEVKPFVTNNLATNANEYFYTFADDTHQWVFLDTSRGQVSQFQLDWLENTLENAQKSPVIFMHHPLLPVKTRVDIDYPLVNREAVANLLTKNGQQVSIFCGHYHTEDSQTQGNITQYMTPSAAFQILQNTDEVTLDISKFSYRIITLDKEKITTKIKWFGRV